MGPSPFYAMVVLTIPPEDHHRHRPQDFSARVKELDLVLTAGCYPERPAGFVQLHATGKANPHKPHPHYNIVVSSKAFDVRTKRLRVYRRGTIDLDAFTAWARVLLTRSWGCNPDRYWPKYSFRAGVVDQQHALKYVIRSQGDGDPVSRYLNQPHRVQLLRPIGMLHPHRGDRRLWQSLNPWGDQRDAAVGSGWDDRPIGLSTCCRSPLASPEPEGDRFQDQARMGDVMRSFGLRKGET